MKSRSPFQSAWVILVPALVAVLVSLNLLANELAYDDPGTLAIAQDLARDGWRGFLTERRGLTFLSVYVDVLLWGEWAPGFHLVSLLWHGVATALVATLAWTLARSRRIALVTGLLFAVHPVHVEVVASVENRKDILALVCVALAALSYFRWQPRWAGRLGAIAIGLVGIVLVKDIAVAGIVLALPLGEILLREGDEGEAKRVLSGLLVATALVGLVLLWLSTQVELGRVFGPQHVVVYTEHQCNDYADVVASVAHAFPTSLGLAFFPVGLSADHPRVDARLGDPLSIVGILLFLAWGVATLWIGRRHRVAGFGMMWVPALLLPATNVVPMGHFFIADRYLYVPSFGACLLIALLFDALYARARAWRRGAVVAVLALLLALGSAWTFVRNAEWADGCTLWTADVERGRASWRAYRGAGTCMGKAGKAREGIVLLRKAVAIHETPETYLDLAGALWAHGEVEESLVALQSAVRLARDEQYEPLLKLGLAYQGLSRNGEAIDAFERALRIERGSRALLELAWLRATCQDAELRDPARAVALAEEALRADVDPCRGRLVLGVAQLQAGRRAAALQSAEAALRCARAQGAEELIGQIQTLIRLAGAGK